MNALSNLVGSTKAPQRHAYLWAGNIHHAPSNQVRGLRLVLLLRQH